jgi:hypothetical protein
MARIIRRGGSGVNLVPAHDPLLQAAQAQIGGIHARQAQFAPGETAVAIGAAGDEQAVALAPVPAQAGRGVFVDREKHSNPLNWSSLALFSRSSATNASLRVT